MKHYFAILLFIGSFALIGCADDEDPCDVKHVIINGECVPDYIFPDNQTIQNGDKYYHQEFGVIIYKDANWVDEWDHIIEDLKIRTD
ncbi:hypothetical protein [Winogradskyella pacifica]|uniref:hypothetical protein n=1 Tax=Winogradskyella pacifica TaxID=664642 RepID=UPI0015C99405|nr:hypothetical protein [Winogradskyella pacifica]